MSLFPIRHFLQGPRLLQLRLFLFLLYALALIFIYAGGVKLWQGRDFFEAILNYHILNREWSWLLALYLPWVEMVAAVALVWPRFRGGALLVLAGLLLIFLGAIVSAWIRELDIDCGCFGSGGKHARYPIVILRDLVLLGVVGILLWWEGKEQKAGERE